SGGVAVRTALSTRTVQQLLPDFGTELSPRRIQIEAELLGETGKNHLFQIAVGLTPGQDDTLEDADAGIAKYELLAHLPAGAESTARRASPERRVEREVAGLELGERDAALRAAVPLGKEMVRLLVGALNFDESFGELEGGLDGIIESTTILGADDEAIDDDGDVVIHPPVQLGRIGDLDQIAVDNGADEALLAGGIEELAELSFAAAHQRGENLEAGSFGPLEDRIGDLARALTLHRTPAVGAVRRPGSGVKEPQVVVDL